MTAAVTTTRDHVYAAPGGIELRFDLHLPAEPTGPLPLAIFLHGGGWLRGTRDGSEAERQRPVAAHGIAVATIDYRLSGDAIWPAQLDDVRMALEVVPAIVVEQGVTLNGRTVLWGCSAGGHLALMAALAPTHGGLVTPDAVVAFFPTTDLTLGDRAPRTGAERMPAFLPPGAVLPPFERLLLGLADGEDGTAELMAASPIAHVRGDAPPILLVHGDQDAMVPLHHSLALHDAIAAAGGAVDTLVVHGATHEDPRFDTAPVLGAVAAAITG